MFNRIKKYFSESEYFRNITTLVSGTLLAQIISLCTIPLLYRIYSIEDYGALGVFMAIVGVLLVLSTLQYDSVIILVKEDHEALKILKVLQFYILFFCIVIGSIIFVFNANISILLNSPLLSNWLFLIPFSVFLLGQIQILRLWANRKKEYKVIRLITITTSITGPLVSLTLGVLLEGWIVGLFTGLLASQILSLLILYLKLDKKKYFKTVTISTTEIKSIAKKYNKFPLFTLPSEFILNFSHQLPIFMISTLFGSRIVGLYDLSTKVLGLPSSLVSGAIREVYKEKATGEHNKTGSLKKTYLKTFKPLTIIAIIGFGSFVLLAPLLFEFVFGEQKREAGYIAQIMAIVYCLRFINVPLSFSFFIKEKQKIHLLSSIWFVLTSLIVFYISNSLKYNYMDTLLLFAINFTVLYLFLMIYVYNISTKDQ